MRVFVAGANGALGTPLTRLLVARGHSVVGLIRDPAGAAGLRVG
jgi:nucleoside-diphosphate-sugar epimerase